MSPMIKKVAVIDLISAKAEEMSEFVLEIEFCFGCYCPLYPGFCVKKKIKIEDVIDLSSKRKTKFHYLSQALFLLWFLKILQ